VTNTAALPVLLRKLKLSAIQTNWQQMSQQAEELHWTYPQYLTTLCDMEAAVRDQRRIAKNILEAKFPSGKTLDTFDFGKALSINSAQVFALAVNIHWVTQAQNLILFGPSGVGKTHLAAAIGRRLAEFGVRVLFAKTTILVHKLQLAHNQHRLSELLAQLAKFQLLILDDIGYVKKTDAETSVLFELIADRYESKSLLITSNHAFDKWDDIFPNNTMAVAAIDRLVHHATIININELSYRKTSKH
jgi:DNA replication protein DnaC